MYDQQHLDQLGVMVHAALPAWSLGRDTEVRLLNVSENATYLLDDMQGGRKLILRVHRPGYHTREEIASELAWIQALRHENIVQTPAPIPGANGALIQTLPLDGERQRHAVAFDFVEGAEPETSDTLPAWFRELGAITARMHLHARAWTPPASFRRKTWNFETFLGDTPHWGPWRAGLGLDAAGAALLDRATQTIARRLTAYGDGPERFGVVHADLRLANLLVRGADLHVIDFDDCGLSWFTYDFAAAVSFIEHLPIVPALQAAWADGYRTVAPLGVEDEAMLPVMVMLRRILLVAWIASHKETPTAQELGTAFTNETLRLAEAFLVTQGAAQPRDRAPA